jgi:predicted nucleotidyltransferase component of viral defense system
MNLPHSQDIFHRIQLYRLLTKILDSPIISHAIHFKGGTAAAMLGFLDRFSVDLDFDLENEADKSAIANGLKDIFKKLNLEIKQKSRNSLFYVVRYQAPPGSRNSIKMSMIDSPLKSNLYSVLKLNDIDRFASCQTKETMFANKLVAVTDRYKKHKVVAGRDIYDIHHFFISGFDYIEAVIEERTGSKASAYLKHLANFIEKKVTDRTINEDLGSLLPYDKFQKIRKSLKKEVLLFLKDRLKKNS